MAVHPYVLSLPSSDSAPSRTLVNGVSAMVIAAETTADARDLAKAQFGQDVDAHWDNADATEATAAADMNGWAMRLRVVSPAGVAVFDETVDADGVDTGFVKATGTLTTSTNPSDTNTVTIGTKVYTLQSSLTNVDGHVKIAASEALTLVNLKNAINASGGTAGVDYAAATVAHTTVEATASAAHTVSVRALAGGSAGNAIATTDTLAAGGDGFGAVTLTGGVGATDKLSSLILKMVAALNSSALIAGSAFDGATLTLTVAETTDVLGDHQVYVYLIPSGADTDELKGVEGFISSITDGGVASAHLIVVFQADTYVVPQIIALLGAVVE